MWRIERSEPQYINPPLAQHGRSCCVSWLVTRTRARERLQAREGERSLLHSAAKYGQVRLTAKYPKYARYGQV